MLKVSIYGVNAETFGFLSIQIPALRANYKSAFKYKTSSSNQIYSSNSTYVNVEVNLHKTGVLTGWKSLSKNQVRTWSTIDYTLDGNYRIEFQQDTSTSVSFWSLCLLIK